MPPDQNKIETARKALLDARDFASTDREKNDINTILDDIDKGDTISALAEKYNGKFPEYEIESLTSLNKKLDNPTMLTTTANSTGGKKNRGWIFFTVIVALVLMIAFFLVNVNRKTMQVMSPNKEKIEQTISTTQTTETTAKEQISTTQTTEKKTETTTVTTTADVNAATLKKIVGSWKYSKTNEATTNIMGDLMPASRDEVYYYFKENGRYSVGDALYEEVGENDSQSAQYVDGRYWICVGGGGQEGTYTIDGNKLILVTDDSIQYGPSTKTTVTFTLDSDTLVLNHSYGSREYKRSGNTLPNSY